MVYVVVQPISKQQAGMTSPLHDYSLFGIVVFEIVGGEVNINSLFNIPEIFLCQGFLIVFVMSHDVYFSAVVRCDDVRSDFIRLS